MKMTDIIETQSINSESKLSLSKKDLIYCFAIILIMLAAFDLMGNLFFLGIIFTGLNPYFIIWWLTAGARLIILALEFAALAGVIFMFICHVWMDYAWLIGLSHFAKKGTNLLGSKWYRYLMVIFGGILIYFGLNFLIDALVL